MAVIDKQKNSILIVDDDPTNLILLGRILGDNYKLYLAKDGDAALALAKKHVPDLILLDIIMPEMDGYQVMAEMKKTPETSEIPVIFISALDSAESEEYGISLNAVDYITKPFNSKTVLARVENHMKMINASRLLNELNDGDVKP